MLSFGIDREDTLIKDGMAQAGEGMPVMYFGRGSFAVNINMSTFSDAVEGVHLVYLGRYSSVGDNLNIICDMNHDFKAVYMGAIPEFAEESDDPRVRYGQSVGSLKREGMTVIGNDVWIGNNVTIISDVVIGNGAVIGAGSMITKDIPPYTIWAGNPARQIGQRFSQDIIDKLMSISWWEYKPEKLLEIKADMKGDVEAFANKYCSEEQRVNKLEREKYIAFVDMESDYPTFCDVVEKFYEKYRGTENSLLLYYHNNDEKEKNAAESVAEIIEDLSNDSKIVLEEISADKDEEVIKAADVFILGRDLRNIDRISYAMKHGTRIISGVDRPMFK